MNELDSLTFAAMLRQGAMALGKEKKIINDLNVFPIPDGDTGDNMYMTIKAGCNALEGHLGTLSEISSAASSGMLLGARGNSGVILSRIFAGLAKGLQGVIVADVPAFDKAMHSAVEEAYKAIPVPVEGTIITVLREGTEGADSNGDLEHYFDTLVDAMKTSLDHTPELLQVLKDAGVVDSGGAGLLCIAQGMSQGLKGETSDEEPVPVMTSTAPAVDLSKFNENSVLEFGYCTEFLLRLMRAKVDLDTFDERVIIDYLNRVGESVVAFRDGSIVKVHVHTFTPGVILNEMQKYGEFLTIKVENMSLQHEEWRTENGERKVESSPFSDLRSPLKTYGVVTVAAGDGLINAFKEMGVDEVIVGGQTMNPSTQDFVEAFKRINAKHILVFPNNSNIKMAAEQAAELYQRNYVSAPNIVIVPSTSIGEGYYGIGCIDRDNPNVEEVVESVKEAMDSSVSGVISTAIRNAEGEVKVCEGDFVGFSGKKILSDSPSRTEAFKMLCRELGAASRDVMIVFYGQNVPEEEAATLSSELQNEFKNLEIIINCGLQPVYDYILLLC